MITYRVFIHPRDGVEIMCFDIDNIDTSVTGRYDTINDIPQWIQKKVAVLMMTNPTPPTEPVEGVGHRIDQNTYWVYQ